MIDDEMLPDGGYVEHVTPADGNVFADIGFGPEEAENLLVRSHLMIEITGMIRERGLKQKQAAALFGVSQPRISDLKRGKIDEFSIDSLVNMLGHAGIRIDMTFRPVEQQAGEVVLEPAAATG
jgi:predicted XRE-type DNA-binding protein